MGKNAILKELVEGRDCATQLQSLLHKTHFGEDDGFLSADQLVEKIMSSFTHTLALLTCHNEISQNLGNSYHSDSQSQERGRKRPSSIQDRRECYKRRKNSETWIIVSPTIEDGQAWRKYGQKDILNAKYPRSYFRCTHKYDQGCRATKYVQQLEGEENQNPPMYQTTYIGLHTCRNMLQPPQIIIKDSVPPRHSYIVNYSDSNIIPPVGSSSSSTVITQESKEEDTPSDLTDNLSVPFDSILWSDFKDFESHIGSDHGDVVSSLDMDFMVKPVDFDNDLHFDETD